MNLKDKVKEAFRLALIHLCNVVSTRTSIDATEVVNGYGFFCWIGPLITQPDFLTTSMYLRIIGEAAPQYVCAAIVTCFFLTQLVFLAFGSVPSYFIKNDNDARVWFIARALFLLISGSLWLFMVNLQLRVHVGVWSNQFLGYAIVCAVGIIKLYFKVVVSIKDTKKQPIKGTFIREVTL